MKRAFSKKGQEIFGLSFGAIFSIIIIAATMVVAFFAIRHFVGLSKCTQIGSFHDDIQDAVTKAWSSGGITRRYFEGDLPASGVFRSGIEKVCFGDLNSIVGVEYEEVARSLRGENFANEANMFIYPTENACERALSFKVLRNVDIESFFCVENIEGKIRVELEKEATEPLVRLGE